MKWSQIVFAFACTVGMLAIAFASPANEVSLRHLAGRNATALQGTSALSITRPISSRRDRRIVTAPRTIRAEGRGLIMGQARLHRM